MLIINSVSKLNRFSVGCINPAQILNKLIERKAIISANIAKLVKPKH